MTSISTALRSWDEPGATFSAERVVYAESHLGVSGTTCLTPFPTQPVAWMNLLPGNFWDLGATQQTKVKIPFDDSLAALKILLQQFDSVSKIVLRSLSQGAPAGADHSQNGFTRSERRTHFVFFPTLNLRTDAFTT
jgi:hypothetical protein